MPGGGVDPVGAYAGGPAEPIAGLSAMADLEALAVSPGDPATDPPPKLFVFNFE